MQENREEFTRCPEWARLYRTCVEQHQLCWAVDAFYHHNPEGWIEETKSLIRITRSSIAKEKKQMQRAKVPAFDANSTATIHQMLQQVHRDAPLLSIINSEGDLVTTAEEVKEVMTSHFESVFDLPPPNPHPLPHPPPSMLFDKSHIQLSWYDDLMNEIMGDELLCVLKDSPLVSAPGEDLVSTGVWKIALQESALLRCCDCVQAQAMTCTRRLVHSREETREARFLFEASVRVLSLSVDLMEIH
jgi:hypothetical protein